MPAPDLKSLFEGILTTQGLQAQQQAQEQQALNYYAQQSDRPWQFLLERSLNQAGAALPNSIQNQQKAQAAANEEVIKRSTAKYGQMVQEGADPGKAQLDVLDSAISEFAKQGNYEAISSLAPTYLALQSKQAELAKLNQQTKTEYAQQQKAETETALAPVLADEKIQTGQSTRTLQSKQGQKIDKELRDPVNIVDITDPQAGPVAAVISPKDQSVQIVRPDGTTKTLQQTQYKIVGQERTGGAEDRPLPREIVNDLHDMGQAVKTVDRLVGGFKNEFAGYGNKSTGNLDLDLKRNIFGDNTGAAQWWQEYYDKYNKKLKLYAGSNVTAGEADRLERADITPAMRPEQIKENLARQQEIDRDAARNKAGVYSKDYGNDRVDTALGFKLSGLGSSSDKPAAAGSGTYDYVPGKGLVPKK